MPHSCCGRPPPSYPRAFTLCLPSNLPTCSFRQYARLVEQELMAKYNAMEHWAKIEVRMAAQATVEVAVG